LEVKGTQGPHTEKKEVEHPWWKVIVEQVCFPHSAISPASPS
jgi:hypothetical protein